jgi:hypothetical protein
LCENTFFAVSNLFISSEVELNTPWVDEPNYWWDECIQKEHVRFVENEPALSNNIPCNEEINY